MRHWSMSDKKGSNFDPSEKAKSVMFNPTALSRAPRHDAIL